MDIRIGSIRQKIFPALFKKVMPRKSFQNPHQHNDDHDPGDQHHHSVKARPFADQPKQHDDQQKTVRIADQLLDRRQFLRRPPNRDAAVNGHEQKQKDRVLLHRRIRAVFSIVKGDRQHDKRKDDPKRIQLADTGKFKARQCRRKQDQNEKNCPRKGIKLSLFYRL